MGRKEVPKGIREKVFDEYDHRCAVCAGDRPHLHHIDEDAENNDINNLLPLCPNCHLRDQHNPTRKIDIPKLNLFRDYKDPVILFPQFHPIYTRLLFLDSVELNLDSIESIVENANELIEFIAEFEMGIFYSKKLKALIGELPVPIIIQLESADVPEYIEAEKEQIVEYRNMLVNNKRKVHALIVEQLRYQDWSNV